MAVSVDVEDSEEEPELLRVVFGVGELISTTVVGDVLVDMENEYTGLTVRRDVNVLTGDVDTVVVVDAEPDIEGRVDVDCRALILPDTLGVLLDT